MNLATRVVRKIHRTIKPLPVERTLDDEYITWLGFAVAGMTVAGNYYMFDHAIRNLPSNNPVLEIGSWCGRSTNALAYLLQQHKRSNLLFTSDKWEYEKSEAFLIGKSDATHAGLQKFLKDSFMRGARTFNPNNLPHTVEMLSDEFFAAWGQLTVEQDVFGRAVQLGGPLSFCFIDGNHAYTYARRDFEHCDAYLEQGGYILFDDSADGSEWEVCRVVEEVKASGKYELVMKNPNYLFRKL